MGISVTVSSATFSNYVGVGALPSDGLLGEYLFGVDATTSIVNYADSASPLTVSGTPSYGSNYVTLTNGASGSVLSTGVNDTADMTMVFVGNANSSKGVMGAWNSATSSANMTAMMATNSANMAMRTKNAAGTVFQTDVAAVTASPLIVIGRCKNEGGGMRVTLDAFQQGAQSTLSETSASARVVTGLPVVIGGYFAASGTITAYGAARYNRYITDDETVLVARYFRDLMASRGVSV